VKETLKKDEEVFHPFILCKFNQNKAPYLWIKLIEFD
jgi:hypothetical protein